MALSGCFAKLFQKSQGEDPALILQQIRANRLIQYHVDATGYPSPQLKQFIAESNCAVVFHDADGFNRASRLNFIDELPASAIATDVVIVDGTFSQTDLYTYAGRKVQIHLCDNDGTLGNMFRLMAFAKRFPDQVAFRSQAFSKAQIMHMYPSVRIWAILHKNDFPDADIDALIAEAGKYICADRSSFNETEIAALRSKGATIIRDQTA